ncbi:hypothetical protein PENSPDRAFT_672662 [Peniophora sp. CONT]|nr:hypothetical protein PENSPDRAFT_672662 [Peniophora sp. CONT]
MVVKSQVWLQPIPYSLPNELLLKILHWVYIVYCSEIAERLHPYLLQETCVCKLWQTLVEGCPEFWQMVVPSPKNEDLRRRALERSRGQPLSCVVSSNATGLRDSTTLLQSILEPGVLGRVRYVKLEHLTHALEFRAGDDVLHTIYPFVIQLVTGVEEASELQDLCVAIKIDFMNASGRPMRNLRRLHFESVCRPPDIGIWAQTLQELVIIRVVRLDGPLLFAALEQMVHLTALEIVKTPLSMEFSERRRRSLVLPKLERITLCIESSDMSTLLCLCSMPELGHMDLLAYTLNVGRGDVWLARLAHEAATFDDVIAVVAAVVERRVCNHVDFGTDLQFKRHVVRSGLQTQCKELVVHFATGNGVAYSYTQRMAYALMGSIGFARCAKSVALNIRSGSGGSRAEWQSALQGLQGVDSLEIAGFAEGVCIVLSALVAGSRQDRLLPSLRHVTFFPIDLDVAVANAVVDVMRHRVGQPSLFAGTLEEFVIMKDAVSVAKSYDEEYRILTDPSLPVAIKFRSSEHEDVEHDGSPGIGDGEDIMVWEEIEDGE